MSEGLRALDQGRWTTAKQAFGRAAGIRPDAPEVRDALARVEAAQRRETIATTLQRAHDFETAERWGEAVKAYSAVLAADPESAAALDGRDRTALRADLDEKLEYHLQNPGRLTNPPVLEDASALLEEASGVAARGPRLAAQLQRLEQLIAIASEPLDVVLESDNFTEVTVYRVGKLGTFSSRQLKLRPGTYTAVGSRAGYRDVRVRFAVMPGSPNEPVVVQCRDQL